jgi:transcriptional regulator with XRE-family HTH domain
MSDANTHFFGAWLRETRKGKGLTLKSVSDVIRIDEPYLRALESGNIAVLPEPYMRAFLKSYAQHLGLNGDEAVQRLEDFLAEQSERLENVRTAAREREGKWFPDGTRLDASPVKESPVQDRADSDRPSGQKQILTAIAVVAVIAVATFLAIRLTGDLGEEAATPPTPPVEQPEALREDQPSDTLAATHIDTTGTLARGGIRQGEPIAQPSLIPPGGQQQARLHLFVAEALEQTWMLAVADGDTVVSRIVYSGNSVRIPYTDTLSIKAGKTHGLYMTVDGREITGLGPPGNVLSRLILVGSEIVERRYTLPPVPPLSPDRLAARPW